MLAAESARLPRALCQRPSSGRSCRWRPAGQGWPLLAADPASMRHPFESGRRQLQGGDAVGQQILQGRHSGVAVGVLHSEELLLSVARSRVNLAVKPKVSCCNSLCCRADKVQRERKRAYRVRTSSKKKQNSRPHRALSAKQTPLPRSTCTVPPCYKSATGG